MGNLQEIIAVILHDYKSCKNFWSSRMQKRVAEQNKQNLLRYIDTNLISVCFECSKGNEWTRIENIIHVKLGCCLQILLAFVNILHEI